EVIGRGVSSAADAGHATADSRTGIGYGAHDGDLWTDALFDIGSGDGRSDGNNESMFPKGRFDFLQNVANDLRLYGEQDDVSALHGLAIIGGSVDTEFDGNCGGLVLVTERSGDALW